jgi:hypothetical protein
MANICDNKFYIFCEDEKITEQISNKLTNLFNEDLYGEITYEDGVVLEGWFESKWRFPSDLFDNFFDEFADEETIYMRCLSEEYGCGLVSMNIYSDGNWWKPQYFDF